MQRVQEKNNAWHARLQTSFQQTQCIIRKLANNAGKLFCAHCKRANTPLMFCGHQCLLAKTMLSFWVLNGMKQNHRIITLYHFG